MSEQINIGIDKLDILAAEPGRIINLARRIGELWGNYAVVQHTAVVDGLRYDYKLVNVPEPDERDVKLRLQVTFPWSLYVRGRTDSFLIAGTIRDGVESTVDELQATHMVDGRYQPQSRLLPNDALLAMGTHIATLADGIELMAMPPAPRQATYGEA